MANLRQQARHCAKITANSSVTLLNWLLVHIYKRSPRWATSRVVRMVKGTYSIGVVAVVFNAEGELLVLLHTYHQPRWRLPGGLMERGESPLDTAAREVYEEANCAVRPVGVVDAAHAIHSFDVAVACLLVQQDAFVQNAEIHAFKWVEAKAVLPDLPVVQQQFVEAAMTLMANRGNH